MPNPHRFSSVALLASIALTLTSCAAGMPGDSLSGDRPAPIPLAPPITSGNNLPSQPLTIQGEKWSPVTETREWHAAATPGSCFDIEARFQREGRKVRLADTKLTGDPKLPFACIFEGEDADPGYVIPPYWR